jgi:hypothetical protein
MGDTMPGNVFGDFTRWSLNADGTISLYVTDGSLVGTHGGYDSKLRRRGVGHWTLTPGKLTNPPYAMSF